MISWKTDTVQHVKVLDKAPGRRRQEMLLKEEVMSRDSTQWTEEKKKKIKLSKGKEEGKGTDVVTEQVIR